VNKIYVGNLPFRAYEEEIRELFAQDCAAPRMTYHRDLLSNPIPSNMFFLAPGPIGLVGLRRRFKK
jgi:hypothetical protein